MDKILEKKTGWKKAFTKQAIPWWLGAIFIIIVVFAIATTSHSTLRVKADAVTVSEVKEGQFNEYIRLNGTVQPMVTVQLSPVEGGVVEAIMIEEGSDVRKGDEILRLSNENLDLQILNSEAELAEKENILRNTQIQMEQDRLSVRQSKLEYQQNVWDETAMNYGEDYAAQYVAVPGYSEHHTGKACDIGIFYADGSQGSFSESRNAIWMRENCGRFGFIRRYAEDKTEITGISNEAWHFRYVGFPHASYMVENNLCLEEYLEYLRNNTSEASPLVIKGNTGSFKVYYTTERTIVKPSGSYTVSGDNMGGFIITVTS